MDFPKDYFDLILPAPEELLKKSDVINNLTEFAFKMQKEFGRGISINQCRAAIYGAFDALPPAVPQPERTCVNCGRTANNGGWYADGGTRCPIEEHYALPKDGFCHLWEKRNITDDDYPERRTDD